MVSHVHDNLPWHLLVPYPHHKSIVQLIIPSQLYHISSQIYILAIGQSCEALLSIILHHGAP